MKVLKLGKDVEVNRRKCKNCDSTLSYTKYDIGTSHDDWVRTGIDYSTRNVKEYIICPICGEKIELKSWTEKF